jgi:hypothetical protein
MNCKQLGWIGILLKGTTTPKCKAKREEEKTRKEVEEVEEVEEEEEEGSRLDVKITPSLPCHAASPLDPAAASHQVKTG